MRHWTVEGYLPYVERPEVVTKAVTFDGNGLASIVLNGINILTAGAKPTILDLKWRPGSDTTPLEERIAAGVLTDPLGTDKSLTIGGDTFVNYRIELTLKLSLL